MLAGLITSVSNHGITGQGEMSTIGHSSEVSPHSSKISLGHHAARGAAWSATYVVAIKVVNFLSQIALAWLLVPSDLGLVGLAMTVATFASLLLQTGIREILIQRGRRFSSWGPPAFWLAMMLGIISVAIMLVVGPWFARVYNDRRLVGLIALLCGQVLANAAYVVPEARLQIDMGFGRISLLSFFSGTFQAITAVILAALGLGPYSVIIGA
ncbi:MAG: oligosaccharide flippase family protein, partial [Tepidisphaeraceae bacterium]